MNIGQKAVSFRLNILAAACERNSAWHPSLKMRIPRDSNLLEFIDSKFSDHFVLECISVDEAVVQFKGKIGFIT